MKNKKKTAKAKRIAGKCEKCGKRASIVGGICNVCFTSNSQRLIKVIREHRDSLLASAKKWATENGLTPPLTTSDISTVERSKNVTVGVTDSKNRSAICTFREDGSRDMFERTDRVTG